MKLPRTLVPHEVEMDGGARRYAMKVPAERSLRSMRGDRGEKRRVGWVLAAFAAMALLARATAGVGAEPEPAGGHASVKRERVPVYAQAAATSERVATLLRGEKVTVDFALTTTEGAWCHVTAAGRTRTAGYVRCDDLDREAPPQWREIPAHPPPAHPLAQTDAISASGGVRQAVFQAARKGDAATLRSMLAHGIDQDTKDAALRTAIINGRADAVRVVIAAGATVNLQDRNGQTPVYLAANAGHTDIVRALLAAGGDPNVRTTWGGTSLMAAALWGHADTVRALLDAGADVNARDQQRQTSLIVAASHAGRARTPGKVNSHAATIQALVSAGAEVDAKDKDGRTGLMHAARNGHIATVQALLAAGANVNAQDKYRGTALREASEGGHTSVARLLRGAGARE